ncbi:hypothetical protein F5Y17DRAFT_461949 [Xylariaceae sp. FL0594]|nr:hypothetical protein F5Y17DRAFT_461949 [Xylariaceae sp. FL0594]
MENIATPPSVPSEQPSVNAQGHGLGGSARRAKPTLSCNLCRRRKLRCDRQEPCQTCSSRGLSLACSYAHINKLGIVQPQVARPSVQDRLVQLEQLIMNVIQNQSQNQNQNPVTSTGAPTPLSMESMHAGVAKPSAEELTSPSTAASTPAASNTGSLWVGGDHWSAILDGIADLKEDVDQHSNNGNGNGPRPQPSHPRLLYGCKPTSKEAIISSLPPKPSMDRSISRYFNMLDLAPSAVHSTQFLREYEKFWMAPLEAPIVWIGLLFSILCLSALADESSDTWAGQDYSTPYTNQGPYVLETLYHYLTTEYTVRKDADKNIWLLLGVIVNLAMGMGYHRDPSKFPALSPLAGEMRRRMWATILQGDLLISTQMGMSRLIREWQCDVAKPSNLNDVDFDEDTTVLPPSRPETEMTTSLHLIARREVFRAVGVAIDLTAAVLPVPYCEVMKVDRILQSAKENIPPPLRMKATSPICAIILHRKYLIVRPAEHNGETFAYSRNACLEASLQLVDIQQIIDDETRPGGLLHSVRWRVSSFLRHEFLTATMILAFVLHQGVEKLWPDQPASTEDQIMTALQKAHSVWSKLSSSSREARKASETLALLFHKKLGQVASLSSPLNFTGPVDLDNLSPFDLGGQYLYESYDASVDMGIGSFEPVHNPIWNLNFNGPWDSTSERFAPDTIYQNTTGLSWAPGYLRCDNRKRRF